MVSLTEEMKRMVREQRLAYVATVSPNGTANLSPKGSISVWNGRDLVFADVRSPGTLANLQRNPTIEINVVDPMVRKGYRFSGTATVLTRGGLFEKIMIHYQRQKENFPDGIAKRARAIVLVKVKRVTPLISPAYDLGLTEREVRATWEQHWQTVKKSW